MNRIFRLIGLALVFWPFGASATTPTLTSISQPLSFLGSAGDAEIKPCADQPATAPESKPEGDSKSKTGSRNGVSEVREIAMRLCEWKFNDPYAEKPLTPALGEKDIKLLMGHIHDKEPADIIPRAFGGSYIQTRATKGMVALWLIEGIRTRRDKGFNFHSLNVLCFKKGDTDRGNDWQEKSIENQDAVAKAYLKWWRRYSESGAMTDFDTDPLKGTGLKWR